MRLKPTLASTLTAALLLSVSGSARAAGGITFSQMSVELTTRQPVAAITVTNGDSDKKIFQVHAYTWTETGGNEKLTETNELLAVPQVMTVAGNSSRVLRIGIRHQVEGSREIPYRIIVAQVPPKIEGTVIAMALQVKLPVFARGTNAPKPVSIDWTAQSLHGSELTLLAANNGDTHAKLIELHVYQDIGRKITIGTLPVSAYLLPGESRTFRVSLSAPPSRAAVIEATSASGPPIYATVPVNSPT